MLRAVVQQLLLVFGARSRAPVALYLVPQDARIRLRCVAVLRSLAIAAAGAALFGVRPAAAAVVNSVQTGTLTMANGTATIDVTITAASKKNSILFFNVSGNSNTPQDGMVSGKIVSPVKLRFRRTGSTALTSKTIRWYVVEFSSGVSVQRKATVLVPGTNNVGIKAVDLSKSFVLMSAKAAGGSLVYGGDTYVRARLTSSTSLELSQDGSASSSPEVHWQVVEYDGASVQRGIGSLTGTQTSATAAISSVDLTKSLVLINWQTDTNGTGPNFLRARLTSSTQITIDRGDATSATLDYAWEVIEFSDGTSVQSGVLAFSSAQTSRTATLTTVDLSRSVALLSTAGGGWGGSHAYTADDQVGPGMFTSTLTNNTTLTLTRVTTGSVAADASWFVLQFAPCIADTSGVSFDVPSRVTVGSKPRWVVAADLDGDSDIDLASANEGSDDLSVLLNNGSATFATEVRYSVGAGSTPVHLVAADVDGDGDIDLVVANRDAHHVTVHINNGSGVFAAAVAYSVGTRPTTVAVADFDGDGDNDIAVGNRDSANCSILLNNGSGVFGAATHYTLGNGAHRVWAADADADGDVDLMFSKIYEVGLSMLTNDGSAGFSTSQLITLGRDLTADGKASAADLTQFNACYSGPGVAYSGGCAGNDTDSDGDVDNDDFYINAWGATMGNVKGGAAVDLITANYSYNKVSVLENLGGGSFGDQFIYSTGVRPVAVVCGDINGAGGNDLVTANSGDDTVSILLNDGSGGFGSPTHRTVGLEPRCVILADLDGDSDNDIIAANYGAMNLTVLLNTSGSFPTETRYPSTGTLRAVASGDLDGDGKADVVMADYAGNQMIVRISNGDGTLGSELGNDTSMGTGPLAVALADFDGDGNLDAVTANATDDTISVRLGKGDGDFANETTYAVGDLPLALAIADFDDDGDEDIVVSNRSSNTVSVLLGDGLGAFAAAVAYATGTAPIAVRAADVDDDGYVDIITGNRDGDNISVLINSGTGTFAAAVNYTAADGPRGMDVGDIDGDGYIDVVTANRDAGNVTVLINNGNGTFAAPVAYTAGTGPTDVICRDLEGDCDVDILIANLDSDDISLLENTGGGVLATQVCFGAGDGALKLALGDLDNDDRPDVIVIGAWANDVSVIMNNSVGTALASAGPNSGYSIPFVEPTAYALNDDASTPTILLAVVVGVAPLMLMLGSPRVRCLASAIGTIAIGWLRTAQQKKDSRERDLGRRQHPRWNWSGIIQIRRLGQDPTWFVRAVNVSLGGMAVLSPESLAVDELVELKTDEHADTWVPARIANITDPKADGDEFRVGVEFLNEDLRPPGAPES